MLAFSPDILILPTGTSSLGGVGFKMAAWEEEARAFATADERGQVGREGGRKGGGREGG
jgi:hypothetical protein